MGRPPYIPPRWADWVLDLFCRNELAEEIRGDLVEAWEEDVAHKGRFRAGVTYGLEVILFIRSHVIRRRDPHRARGSVMWKNYLTVAVRSARKQKTWSAINFLGLAIGLAFATAGIQAWRAARLNPVEAIRTD